MQMLVDDFLHALLDPRIGSDALSCRPPSRADGGPQLLEMLFRRDRQAHLMLDTMVQRDPSNRRRYIDAHVRHPHV
jgi:hypothetical protein